jgi:hypothetical protein
VLAIVLILLFAGFGNLPV